jgi:hypothetical protein
VSDAAADRLIAQWASAHAPELLARAQADALEIARERLRDRLVDALLEAAEGGAAPQPPAAEPPASEEPLLWVYGIVGASADPPADPRVDGRPVRLHRHAGVTALVSDVPRARYGERALKARLEDLGELEALARAHEATLQAAMAGGAVVPFRLCTIYASPERLDAMLDAERLELTAALERLDGMQEWGVKAFLHEAAPVPAAAEPATGTEYLSRKRARREAAEAGREAIETVVAEVHARLAERAAAAVLSRPQDRRLSGRDTEMVLNAAYLVPRDQAGAFRDAVSELGRRHEPDGVELELTGPWPPHHFVDPPEL